MPVNKKYESISELCASGAALATVEEMSAPIQSYIDAMIMISDLEKIMYGETKWYRGDVSARIAALEKELYDCEKPGNPQTRLLNLEEEIGRASCRER